jgi:protein-L-isoaspartate(D-aspartate) O-methyltransferase
MMNKHIETRDVKDKRVLAAIHKVDRERFIPEDVQSDAYADRALSIGYGQTISQPYIVALMTELLELRGQERVLEIGTGSGYQAAILAELAKEVYSIEIVPELAEPAAKRLQELGCSNVATRLGDGYHGWPEKAPFDAIIVTCSPDHVPAPLADQLTEGGRLVIPVGPWPNPQKLIQMTKREGKLEQRPVIPVSFVPMTGELK